MSKEDKEDMGVIAKSDHELKLYYHPGNRIAKQSIAVAEASKAKKVLVNLAEENLTETQWGELSRLLDKDPTELIDTSHPFIKETLSKNPDLNPNQAVKILKMNPEVLKHPIAMRGDKVIQVKGINDIMHLQEADSKDAKLP
ncbi:arsenate reductase family protein [Psychroflexus sediminis]|uniref:ArsC family protein n=1 Tax=Psychroflexus sediminis TaxID=470826 RepID=A0A1G7XN71_9FLAO|nr:ArsC family transcriptional regulator [Psychroflexus sediminis]SDG85654.1 ArsC family protein [Psychroflexus sediminis]